MKAEIISDLNSFAAVLGCPDQEAGFFYIGRQRLLNKDVGAAFKCLQSHAHMSVGRGTYKDDVWSFLQCFPRGEEEGDIKGFFHLPVLIRIGVGGLDIS